MPKHLTVENEEIIKEMIDDVLYWTGDTEGFIKPKDGNKVKVEHIDGVQLDLDSDATIFATPDDDLAEKYVEAKGLTPNGFPLSAINRAALILMPGVYVLPAELEFDTNYVDVIGLGAGDNPAVEFVGNTINVTAWDIRVVGLSTGTQQFKVTGRPDITGATGTSSNNTINIPNHGLRPFDVVRFTSLAGGTGLSTDVRYEVAFFNFTPNSFRIRLEGDESSTQFSTNITDATLAVDSNQSQTFDACFGAGALSFGGLSTASGVFRNCFGGPGSFGTNGRASGVFIDCVGGPSAAFGSAGIASGLFTNCTGGNNSFGGDGGVLNGRLYYCRLTNGTFPTVSGNGIIRLCIDGNNVENNQGGEYVNFQLIVAASDEFTNLTQGTNKVTFRVPREIKLTEVRASVNTAPVGSAILVDIKQNASSIFSTQLQIDAGTKTSVGSSVPAVISTETLTDDAELTVDIVQVGSSVPGTGLKITLLGYRL